MSKRKENYITVEKKKQRYKNEQKCPPTLKMLIKLILSAYYNHNYFLKGTSSLFFHNECFKGRQKEFCGKNGIVIWQCVPTASKKAVHNLTQQF